MSSNPINPYESPQLDPLLPPDPDEPVLAELVEGEKLGAVFGSLFIVGLAVAGWFNPTIREAYTTQQLWLAIWAVIVIVQDAAGLAALGLLVWRKAQRQSTFPRFAGHWLLLIQVTSFIAEAAYESLYYFYMRDRWEDPDVDAIALKVQAELFGVLFLFYCVMLVVAGLAAWKVRERLWQRYILFVIMIYVWYWAGALLTGTSPFDSPSWIVQATNTFIILLAATCWLLAFARDYSRKGENDLLHWFGTVCQLGFLFTMAWNIYLNYMRTR